MAEGSEDKESKTEDPTQHRLEEAAKKGQVPTSRDLNHFFAMLALAIMIAMLFPGIMEGAKEELAPYLTRPHDIDVNSEKGFQDVFAHSAYVMAGALFAPLALILLLVVGPALMQGRFIVALDRISPKWEKISPMKGLGRLFSKRTLVEFLKGLVKIGVVSLVAYIAIKSDMHTIETLPDYPLQNLNELITGMALHMLIGVCCVLFLLGIFDYGYQYFDFMKSMRMSQQEIRDEHKQQEGDPHIKGKLKQIRMEKARKRMMANVPKSDVVITNPTHFAVALQYDRLSMGAPRLVAKGADDVAFRIRKLAEQHEIPIVENKPLARSLYADVDMDEEIPFEHYKAVAEVISYVYKLKGKLK